MELTAFSVSLAVQELERSQLFYERIGFRVVDGGHLSKDFPDTASQRWRVMKRGACSIRLFQGTIENNILTLHCTDLPRVVRDLIEHGILPKGSDANAGHIMLQDPDGNPVLIEKVRS